MADEGKKEYYEKKPGFAIKSGTPQPKDRITDYQVITDNSQGFSWTTDGEHRQVTNRTSYELSGVAKDTPNGKPAKIIRTQRGDIIIDAMDGDITIKAKNIRLVGLDGAGEVTITAGKHFAVNAPVHSLKGTNSNTVMSSGVSIGAQTVDTTGNMQNTSNSGSEEAQGSILTKLLGVVKKFKSFFD